MDPVTLPEALGEAEPETVTDSITDSVTEELGDSELLLLGDPESLSDTVAVMDAVTLSVALGEAELVTDTVMDGEGESERACRVRCGPVGEKYGRGGGVGGWAGGWEAWEGRTHTHT